MLIKVNDTVQVITGNDRGVQGRVLKVDRQAEKVIVEGVNQVYKHVRRSQRNPQGGRLSKEMPIRWCNVMLICGSCNQGVRVGARYNKDGSKVRYCKKCGSNLGEIAPERKAYAS